jgi:hypothetical protein
VARPGELVEDTEECRRDDESGDETGERDQGDKPDRAHDMCACGVETPVAGALRRCGGDADGRDASLRPS